MTAAGSCEDHRLAVARGCSQVNRRFVLAGALESAEIGDVDVAEAPVGALPRLVEEGVAS
jgi:hypothetical protein